MNLRATFEHPGRLATLTVFFSLLSVIVAQSKPPEPRRVFYKDLHPFGFITEAHGHTVGSFNDISFLSNDLLLVTVNTRTYGAVEPSFSDQPVSKLLLFDVSRGQLVMSTEMPLEKAEGSVRTTRGGKFVLLNESGLHLCSLELECGSPFPTRGPLFSSPQGTRIVVGGNARTPQKLLDGDMKEVAQFPWGNPNVVPGDSGLLIRQDGKLFVRFAGRPDQPLSFGGSGIWPEARFLNQETIADFESDKALAVARVDGTVLFRVPVTARWELAEVTTAASGSRFCLHQAGYTRLNSIVNFLDIDNGRPFNFESVSVISVDTGKVVLEQRWDPRPYVGLLAAPALSPDGRKLAIIRKGFLEVYDAKW
jgi:hypothetical protein